MFKGFGSVYYAKVHCPVCKEEIFANALACPKCKTDFTQPPYNKRTNWQNTAMKIVLVISAVIGTSICFSDAPVILGIIVGLALYGGGYVIVQKIQSFKNYHHK
ncbi:MAG: hypothetical protein KDE33_06440 [Bacteroidetes bacterium]|nr:hypothetical protein [Bacteroidota bacterium]